MFTKIWSLLWIVFFLGCNEVPQEWFFGANWNISEKLIMMDAAAVWNEKTKQQIFLDFQNQDEDVWDSSDYLDGRHVVYKLETDEEIALWKSNPNVQRDNYPDARYDGEDIIMAVYKWGPKPYSEEYGKQNGVVMLHELGHSLGMWDIKNPKKPTIMKSTVNIERNLDEDKIPTIQKADVERFCFLHYCE